MKIDNQLISNLKDIIKEAGRISLDYRRKGLTIEQKVDNSPVSNADKEISKFIYKNLSKLFPEFPIICEERQCDNIANDIENGAKNKKSFWLIDPIDGTRSYINDEDDFTVNIAIVENNQAEYGLIYQPTTKRLYFTNERQEFCIEEDDKLVAPKPHDKNGFVAVMSKRASKNKKTIEYIEGYNFVEQIVISSSIKLCMLAEGIADVYPKFGPTMEWDIAAGHALIRAAGGDIITPDNKQLLYGKIGFLNGAFVAAASKFYKIMR